MAVSVLKRVRPKHGFAHFLHLSLVAVVPLLVYVFVRLDFYDIAIAVVLLSKWRMFAIKPRHWLAHIRTNAVDIIVSLSIVTFMIAANGSLYWQLWWLLVYEIWVLYLKPGSSVVMVSLQALAAQFAGLAAVFMAYETAPAVLYVLAAGGIGYFVARHFFGTFEEKYSIQFSWLWSYFAASLVWVMSHWLVFYGPVAQPAVMLSVIGYGLAGLYYLHEHDRLSSMVRRQIIFIVFVVIGLMLIFLNSGDGIIK